MRDDMYDDILEQYRWQLFHQMTHFYGKSVADMVEVEPLSYAELITHSDALWAHEIGVIL